MGIDPKNGELVFEPANELTPLSIYIIPEMIGFLKLSMLTANNLDRLPLDSTVTGVTH